MIPIPGGIKKIVKKNAKNMKILSMSDVRG